jgi:hypothetical protein
MNGEKPCDTCRKFRSTNGPPIILRKDEGLPCIITKNLQHRISVLRPANRAKKSAVPGSPSDEFLLPQRWCISLSSPSAPFFPVAPLHRRVPYLVLRRGYLAFGIPPRHFRELSSVFMIDLSALDVFRGGKITVRTLIFLVFWNTLDARNTFSGILALQA